MPTLNAATTVKLALESALNQSLQHIEVLCVDNGSTDDTPLLLNAAAADDSRIQLFNEKTPGAGPSRNTGLRNARGTFVAFLDADDRFASTDTLEFLLKYARNDSALITGGSLCAQLPTGEMISRFDGLNAPFTFEKSGPREYSEYQFDYGFYRFIYNRAMLVNSGLLFPPYMRFQDPPFFVRAMLAARSFTAVDQPSYIHCLKHNPIQWDVKAIVGLLNGLRDNLRLSRARGLSALHRLTVDRITSEYATALSEARLGLDESVLLAESACLSCIDLSMLHASQKQSLLSYYRDRNNIL